MECRIEIVPENIGQSLEELGVEGRRRRPAFCNGPETNHGIGQESVPGAGASGTLETDGLRESPEL